MVDGDTLLTWDQCQGPTLQPQIFTNTTDTDTGNWGRKHVIYKPSKQNHTQNYVLVVVAVHGQGLRKLDKN